METKKELDALEQLELIKSTVLDKDGLLPTSGKDFIIWGIISTTLFMGMPLFFIYQELAVSIISSSIFMFSLLVLGLFISFRLRKQKNKEKERKFSKYQEMLKYISISATGLGFTLSVLLAQNFSIFIPLIWMYLIGMTFIVEGYFSIKILTKYGLFLISLSSIISLVFLFFIDIQNCNESLSLYYISATIASLSLGVGMITLGIKLLKKERLNV